MNATTTAPKAPKAPKTAPAKAKAPKAPKAKVTTTITAVNGAWRTFCKATTTNEKSNRVAVLALADVIQGQTASINSVKKSIDDTAQVSPLITSSQVRTLPTFKALEKKHAEFRALPLKSALTLASKAYDLLGKGEAEKHSFIAMSNLVNDAQAEKTRKAKEAKAGKSEKPAKDSKKPATLEQSLQAVLALVSGISDAPTDKEIDLLNDIVSTIESKMLIEA
jgi:hypothetical protein